MIFFFRQVVSVAATQLVSMNRHTEHMSQCAVLCANKTLFTKIDQELD